MQHLLSRTPGFLPLELTFWNAFWTVSDCSLTGGTFWKEAPIVTISFPETRIYKKKRIKSGE